MRRDMGNIVIERPRRGSSHRSPKVRDFGGRINEDNDYDGMMRLPSSSEKIYGQAARVLPKEFTDVLGPLRRYLVRKIPQLLRWRLFFFQSRTALFYSFAEKYLDVVQIANKETRAGFRHYVQELANDWARYQTGLGAKAGA